MKLFPWGILGIYLFLLNLRVGADEGAQGDLNREHQAKKQALINAYNKQVDEWVNESVSRSKGDKARAKEELKTLSSQVAEAEKGLALNLQKLEQAKQEEAHKKLNETQKNFWTQWNQKWSSKKGLTGGGATLVGAKPEIIIDPVTGKKKRLKKLRKQPSGPVLDGTKVEKEVEFEGSK